MVPFVALRHGRSDAPRPYVDLTLVLRWVRIDAWPKLRAFMGDIGAAGKSEARRLRPPASALYRRASGEAPARARGRFSFGTLTRARA